MNATLLPTLKPDQRASFESRLEKRRTKLTADLRGATVALRLERPQGIASMGCIDLESGSECKSQQINGIVSRALVFASDHSFRSTKKPSAHLRKACQQSGWAI